MNFMKIKRKKSLIIASALLIAIIAGFFTFACNPVLSISSLKQHDRNLYEITIYGDYGFRSYIKKGIPQYSRVSKNTDSADYAWACSVFTAQDPQGNRLFGRNFDWDASPILIVKTKPSKGYASISFVEMNILGVRNPDKAGFFEKGKLLSAPYFPIDGINEEGFAIALLSVPTARPEIREDRITLHTQNLIRLVLDNARNVEEALALIEHYNFTYLPGPPVHFFLTDKTGKSAVLEFVNGKNVILSGQDVQILTNFVLTQKQQDTGHCIRYDTMKKVLSVSEGILTREESINLLFQVSQHNTQRSTLYDTSQGMISIYLDRKKTKEFMVRF